MKPSPRRRFRPLGRQPLVQLVLARLRESYREPEVLFWVYGFPILLVAALGIAFRHRPVERIAVAIQASPLAQELRGSLQSDPRLLTTILDAQEARRRLRTGKTNLVVVPLETDGLEVEYHYDPTRPDSLLARTLVNDAIQNARGRRQAVAVHDHEQNVPGARYVDFLVPGLLGMSLMGGGLWGVGFVTVDMRIRKLLKRLVATPMKKRDFLAGILVSRLFFIVPEMIVILLFARIAFGVVNHGRVTALALLILIGAGTFAGLGLLVASRPKTLEAVSGLMNLVMLPQWIFSGIFFSSERFPDWAQPAIKFLPLTPLIDALRAVMLEGASLTSLLGEIAGLLIWALVSFVLALRWFRWT